MIGFGKTARNIGSKVSQQAASKASAISMGDNSRRIVKHTGGGSSAGLNAQKSTYLEPKGRGYSNPDLHRKENKSYPRYDSPLRDEAIFRPESNVNHRRDMTNPKGLL